MSVRTTIPSCAGVRHEACRRFWPSTSTMQSRHAPTSLSPPTWQRRGIRIPCSQATEKMESPSRPVTILPSICRVLDAHARTSCGLGGNVAVPGGTAFFADMRLVLLREIFERADDRVGRGLAQPTEAGLPQQL